MWKGVWIQWYGVLRWGGRAGYSVNYQSSGFELGVGWDQGIPSCSLEGLCLMYSEMFEVCAAADESLDGCSEEADTINSQQCWGKSLPDWCWGCSSLTLTEQSWNTDLLVASLLKIDRPYHIYQLPHSFSSLLICSAINKCNIWNGFGNQHLSEPENEIQYLAMLWP